MRLDSHLPSLHNQKSSCISNSTSSTSLSPIEDLNFDALKDPTDGTLAHPCRESSPVSSSFRYLTSSDDFVVQTPSKSINESDQQSFHLSSPPSGFGNLGGTTNAKSINSFRPRVLFRNNNFGPEKALSTSLVRPIETLIAYISKFSCCFDFKGSIRLGAISHHACCPPVFQCSTTRSVSVALLKVFPFQIKGFNVPLNIQSSKRRFSFVGPLNQPKSSTSDSIALSMAKMTVWNRMAAASTPIAHVKTQQPVANESRLGLSVLHQISSSPGVKLPYPVQKEPEFTIRRILQMGYGVST